MSKTKIFLLIIILSGIAVHAFNLNNQLFWDDEDWILNNTFVHSISWDNVKFWFTHNTLAGIGLPSNYYRPFLFLTFAINYSLHGASPLGWHLVSNMIHLLAAVALFFLLRMLVRERVAWLVALLFVLHPLQTEAVAYIAGRGDPLVSLWMILALLLFVYAERHELSWKSWKRWATIPLLVFALLSRETAIIFPLLLVVVTVFMYSWSLKLIVKKTWPYFAVTLIYGILRLTVLNFQNTLNFYTAPNLYSEHLWYRILTFFHVILDYLRLLVAPLGLHMERSMTVHTSVFQWPVWLGILLVLGLLGVLWYSYRHNRERFGIWWLGAGWFFVSLAPVSGITPINAVLYEHWLYLPMVGFWLVIAYYVVALFERSGRTLRTALVVGGIIYVGWLGYLAVQRNILWGKPIAFFEDILRYEPTSARVNNNLGNLYFKQGDKDRAAQYYRQAVGADDALPQPHFNLGSILQTQGDAFGAIKEYEAAIALDPNFYFAYQNIIVIYAQQGEYEKALTYLDTLKTLRPDDPRVWYNGALILIAKKDTAKAREYLQEGLKVVGSDAEAKKLIEDLLNKLK